MLWLWPVFRSCRPHRILHLDCATKMGKWTSCSPELVLQGENNCCRRWCWCLVDHAFLAEDCLCEISSVLLQVSLFLQRMDITTCLVAMATVQSTGARQPCLRHVGIHSRTVNRIVTIRDLIHPVPFRSTLKSLRPPSRPEQLHCAF